MFVGFVGCVVCYGYFAVLWMWFACFVNLVFIVYCFWLFTYVLSRITIWVVCVTISVGDGFVCLGAVGFGFSVKSGVVVELLLMMGAFVCFIVY